MRNQKLYNNLEEIKQGLENLTDTDLVNNRMTMLEIVNDCLNQSQEDITA